MKKAIFLYDYIGLMAKPWLDAGYECWSFDGQHKEGIQRDGNHVKVGMWFNAKDKLKQSKIIADLVGDEVEIVFGFPECTDLSNAGARHFEDKRKKNPLFQLEATELADLVRIVGVLTGAKWAFENPISAISTIYRKPDFIFHPYQYGGYLPLDDVHPLYPRYIAPRDAYLKKTCIWSGNGFVMPKKIPAPPIPLNGQGGSDAHNKLGGKNLSTKNIRSATPRGFAKAVCIANASMKRSFLMRD